jgi:hypothetical protein
VLAFAVVASLMSVCGFAADADVVGSANGMLNDLVEAYADFVGPIVDEYNCSAGDFIFDTGLNGFFGSIDEFFESICVGIVELVATIENLFK